MNLLICSLSNKNNLKNWQIWVLAQQIRQIILQWLSHFPPVTWNSCRLLSPQERWVVPPAAIFYSVTSTCAKLLLGGCEVQSSAHFVTGSISKSSRVLLVWFGWLHRNISCTNSCWVSWAWGTWVVISAIVPGKISCIRKTGPKHSVMPHHVYFSCRSPPPPPKEK